MESFNDVYIKSKRAAIMEKRERIEREHAQVVSAVKRIYGVDDFNKLDECDRMYYRDLINNVWSKEDGLNEKGERLVNESVVPLMEGCSDADIEKRFKREVSKEIKNIASCLSSDSGNCVILQTIRKTIESECGRKLPISMAKEWLAEAVKKYIKSKIKF